MSPLCNTYVNLLKVFEQFLFLPRKKKILLYKASYFLLQSFTYQNFIIMTPEAERFNGWAAMLGFVAAVGAYVTTGQIIPGWF